MKWFNVFHITVSVSVRTVSPVSFLFTLQNLSNTKVCFCLSGPVLVLVHLHYEACSHSLFVLWEACKFWCITLPTFAEQISTLPHFLNVCQRFCESGWSLMDMLRSPDTFSFIDLEHGHFFLSVHSLFLCCLCLTVSSTCLCDFVLC